jgi:DNA-binding transcriptional MocR family regulator
MDDRNNVVYIYSFALTLIPGISIAAVVGDPRLIHAMQYLVSVRVISISWITQKIVTRYLAGGRYRSKIEEMVQHNRRNRDIMCASLDRLADIGVEYTKPRGGVYIWVKLPSNLDAEKVVWRAASEEGLALVPGNVFYPLRNAGRDHIRLNYSYESTEWLIEGMRRLTKLLRTMYTERTR